MSSVSFVLPAFNESANIADAVRRCVGVAGAFDDYEVIVVDDGSSDDTRNIVDGLSVDNPAIRSVHHPENRGYGAALKSGLLAAGMDRVFFTDADLQFDVSEIHALVAHADEHGVVAGFRSPRHDPWLRCLNGWAWSWLVNRLFGTGVRDVDCAFKLFDRRVFEQIEIESIGAFVNTEILVRARAAGFTVKEVPVSHFPRGAGVATGAHLRVILRAFRELASLYWELRKVQSRAM